MIGRVFIWALVIASINWITPVHAGGAGGGGFATTVGADSGPDAGASSRGISQTPHERAWQLALENSEFQNQLQMLTLDAVVRTNVPAIKAGDDARKIALALIREGKRVNNARQHNMSFIDAIKAFSTLAEIFVKKQYPGIGLPLSIAKVGTAFATAYTYHRFFE